MFICLRPRTPCSLGLGYAHYTQIYFKLLCRELQPLCYICYLLPVMVAKPMVTEFVPNTLPFNKEPASFTQLSENHAACAWPHCKDKIQKF